MPGGSGDTVAAAPLEAGLAASLPAHPGPWLSRCIERWGLTAPFDPAVTEAQWQAYFQERAALEWHTNAVLAQRTEEGSDDDDDDDEKAEHKGEEEEEAGGGEGVKEGEQTKGDGASSTAERPSVGRGGGGGEHGAAEQPRGGPSEWPYEWQQPSLQAFCPEFRSCWDSERTEAEELGLIVEEMRGRVEALLAGCTHVPNVAEMARALGAGCFVTRYHIMWEDSDRPRDVALSTRLYSPCALATSVELKFTWHRRLRASFAEQFCFVNFELRGAGGCDPACPQREGRETSGLFGMDVQDSGYEDRSSADASELRRLAAHLFGRKGLISERKALAIAAVAAGVTAVPGADASFAFRVNRRERRLSPGEETDCPSGEDSDSGNERLGRQHPPRAGAGGPQYENFDDFQAMAAMLANVMGIGGGGAGGFGGGGSDSEDFEWSDSEEGSEED